MVAKTYIDAFIPEGKSDSACVTCGICLQKCPVMKMEKKESQEEFHRLLTGENTKRVLHECTFCYGCNSFCPQGLRPYNLIMQRMVEKNAAGGRPIPDAMSYMMTGKNESGYFFDIYKSLPAADREILEKWSRVPAKSGDVLFVGCVGRTFPGRLEHSKALASLPKYGPIESCCGEIPHRFGDYAYFSETVERTHKLLEPLEAKRLVCYCGSCSNYLGNIWPKDHGVRLPFEIISVYEWLWEKYQAGALPVVNKFSKQIAISDSCYASELGDNFFTAVRGLHEAVGMEPVELPHNRHYALSCGFAAGLRNNYDQQQVKIEAKKKIDEIAATGMKEVSVNCPGCWAGIGGAAKAAGADLKVKFAISEILWAFGDDPPGTK